MAKAQMKMPDDFLLKVSTLANKTDEIVPKVLKVGGEIVKEKVKSNIASVTSGNSTGQLERSLGVAKPLQDKNGNWNVKVGFAEPRADGQSNAKIANILEYGKHGQRARPFLRSARRQSEVACVEAMKEKLEREIDSL